MMHHRTPHQEHSKPRSRTSSGNYNTKQQLQNDEPLPSPSKTSSHHSHHTPVSAGSKSQNQLPMKGYASFIGLILLVLFMSFLLWNLHGVNEHEFLKFSIHDSYSGHDSHYSQRGRRSKGGTAGGTSNGEGSETTMNHFNSKYVEILTRNWLLQQFKSLQVDFIKERQIVSPASLQTASHNPKQASEPWIESRKGSKLLLVQPNTIFNLTSRYEPFHSLNNGGANLWDLFPPVMNCPDLQRIGRVGEGGKWICGLSYLQSSFGPDDSSPCVIYSFGINDDISFEIELLLRTECDIFAFDPTIGELPIHNHLKPGSETVVLGVNAGDELLVSEVKRRTHFEKIALSDVTGSSPQFLWNEALYDIMRRHAHSFIHLLKVDIESSEWRIFSSLFQPHQQSLSTHASTSSVLPVGEILIELHYESVSTTIGFFEGLYAQQFYSVSREINLIPTLNGQKPVAAEYTFVNVNNFYGVHPSLPAQATRKEEEEISATSLRSAALPATSFQWNASLGQLSSSSQTLRFSTMSRVNGLIYFLTQRKRLTRMCEALRLLYTSFLEQYRDYPIIIFHDDLTAADESFLQQQCLSSPSLSSSPNDSEEMKREREREREAKIRERSGRTARKIKLRFARIDFRIPKHLTKRNFFIPKRTFCDPTHSSIGYRHMCRFHAFAVHKELNKLTRELFKGDEDYYIWRLDDDSLLSAPIGYDIFQFMAMNRKMYGFVSMLKDDEKCVMGLWETSRRFFSNSNLSMEFAHLGFNYSESLLPYWPKPVVIYNNFEISHSSLWRHPLWLRYRDYLDWLGGIYTLRWGDAPIHTIIITAILDRRQIHKFSDIGYAHLPFLNQKPKGLPMPGMDPFLLMPVECHYFQDWKCKINLDNNSTSNYSFSSMAQRDEFLVSVSLVKSSKHQTSSTNSPNPQTLHLELPEIPNKERGVIFTFGEINREDLLVQTIKNFYLQFARRFHIPFVIFYDQLSAFNETRVTEALTPLSRQSGSDALHFLFFPMVLPNITSPGTNIRVEKNRACWMNRHDKELSVSLFLQREAFDILFNLGYEWFFRIPDDARLLMPVTYNPFARLEASGKKYGFMSSSSFEVEQQPCLSSLLSFVREFCAEIDDLSTELTDSFQTQSGSEGGWGAKMGSPIPILPRCSSFFRSDWDKRSLFVTGLAISHVSIWQSLFASFFFDVTHPKKSEDEKAQTLTEELLSSLSSSSTSSSSKKKRRDSTASSASGYQSLLMFLERMKAVNNATTRSMVMNWNDNIVHNLILFTSTSVAEIEKLPHFYATIAFTDTNRDSVDRKQQSLLPASSSSSAVSAIASRQALHRCSDAESLNGLFVPQRYGWLGGDVGVSIPFPNTILSKGNPTTIILPPKKLLWLFGDTFLGVTTPAKRVKEHAKMVDNSVAISVLAEVGDDKVSCEEREETPPLRQISHHQYYHQLFSSSSSDSEGGIFRLTEKDSKGFCDASKEKVSVWPIGGIFAFDSEENLRLIVLADVTCQRKDDVSSSTSENQADLFNVQTLLFQTKRQALYRVKNPLDSPDLWQYDVIPLSLADPLRKDEQDARYGWISMAESEGKYFANSDDFILILSSSSRATSNEERDTKTSKSKSDSRHYHHGFFRIKAKHLLSLDRIDHSTAALQILDSSGTWTKFGTDDRKAQVPEMRDLFAPVEHLFPNYRVSEASLLYDTERQEWVMFHVNTITLHLSYLYCTLPRSEMERSGGGFHCEYIADVGKKWLHPTVITYAGHLHPHLLHPALNDLQMQWVQRGVCGDGVSGKKKRKRRIVASQVSNTATSLDLLFAEFSLEVAIATSISREQDAPSSKEIYVPRFFYIREI